MAWCEEHECPEHLCEATSHGQLPETAPMVTIRLTERMHRVLCGAMDRALADAPPWSIVDYRSLRKIVQGAKAG